MKFYELTISAQVLNDIHFTKTYEVISKSINATMLMDQKLKQIHPMRCFKYYCFNSFFPLEKEKIYKKNRIYLFKIRSLDNDLITKFEKLLPKVTTKDLKIISLKKDVHIQKPIKELICVTPVIITVDNKPWMQDNDLITLIQRLHDNARKKYELFTDNCIENNHFFIEKFKILNNKPMVFDYKGKHLLGHKLKMLINKDDTSQLLAFTVLGCGLGEKNSSIGAGFCDWR